MSGIGLSKALTGDTLRRFATLAGKSQSPAAALRGPLGQDQAITSGLRIGARTFSAALDGLNSAVSFVNLSQKTLQDLSKITDRLVEVTRRATDVASSNGTRSDLQIEFRRLAGEFRRTVRNATTGDNEFLTKSGLEEVFATIGLDKKSSSSIAAIFSNFVTPLGDDALASERVVGNRTHIPIGAFTSRGSDAEYLVDSVAPIEADQGYISAANSVVAGNDTVTGQNPGYKSILTVASNSSITGLAAGLSSGVGLLAVNEESGYSVVVSSEDFLGYNSGNYEQLFLVDNSGIVIHQYTNNSSGTTTYTAADVSSDSKRVTFVEATPSDSFVRYQDVSTFGEDPSGYAPTTIDNAGSVADVFLSLKISNSGDYIAYGDDSSGFIEMYRVSTLSFSVGGAAASDAQIGFLADDQIAFWDPGSGAVVSQDFDAGLGFLVFGLTGIANFSTLQGHGFALYQNDSYQVTRYDTAGVAQEVYQLAATDSVLNLSMATSADGGSVDIGVLGNIGTFGHSGTRLYRFKENPAFATTIQFNAATPLTEDPVTGAQRNSIFDENLSLTSRGQAFRTLQDLEALREQLKANINALDVARNTLNENIKLVRSTGLAFLEAAEQVNNLVDAEKLAENLRQRIRQSAPTALSQAENLNPLIVAALTQGG